jgi:hypothetical protein
MNRAEAFADRVSNRLRRNLSVVGIGRESANLTGVEVIAIIGAIIAACDQFNPGWRDQVGGFLARLLPPWGERARQQRFADDLRRRASRALAPELVGPFGRSAARNDRALVLSAARNRMQAMRDVHGDDPPPPDSAVADAILEQTVLSDDATILGVLGELAPR